MSYADRLCALIVALGVVMFSVGLDAHEHVKAAVSVVGCLGVMYGALRGEP